MTLPHNATSAPIPASECLLPHRLERERRLAALGAPLVDWLRSEALPRWSTTGVDRAQGGFFEKIDLSGRAVEEPRRARVVARQIYVFTTAARNGWLPGAKGLVEHGLRFLLGKMRLPDGLFCASVGPDDSPVDATFDLYEHAFVLFALASAFRIRPDRVDLLRKAEALLARLRLRWSHPAAGFEESDPPTVPLKSNPHMHLLEAALEWLEVAPAESKALWHALCAELVGLCLDRFIDANGALHEVFDSDWRSFPGEAGRLVEPGHQFEWAWLLMRCQTSGLFPLLADRAGRAATRLLEIGETHGVDTARGVAINAIDTDFRVLDPAAKLWPQTERVKAWRLAAQLVNGPGADAAEARLRSAIAGLSRYLIASPTGLWSEQMAADGRFVMQDCRASSLYHVVCAIDVLHAR